MYYGDYSSLFYSKEVYKIGKFFTSLNYLSAPVRQFIDSDGSLSRQNFKPTLLGAIRDYFYYTFHFIGICIRCSDDILPLFVSFDL